MLLPIFAMPEPVLADIACHTGPGMNLTHVHAHCGMILPTLCAAWGDELVQWVGTPNSLKTKLQGDAHLVVPVHHPGLHIDLGEFCHNVHTTPVFWVGVTKVCT